MRTWCICYELINVTWYDLSVPISLLTLWRSGGGGHAVILLTHLWGMGEKEKKTLYGRVFRH